MSEDKTERLVISTKKSLYDPVEIEIDEVVYQSRKITRPLVKEINEIEKQIEEELGNDDLKIKWIDFVFEIDAKILDQLDIREVQQIYFHSQSLFQKIEVERIKLVKSMFDRNIASVKQVQKTIPNRTRPGNKA